MYRFENDYGASVINDGYGSGAGLKELALLIFDDKFQYIAYNTDIKGINNGIAGWLSEKDVNKLLYKIKNL